MSNDGWIKVFRKIKDWEWFSDSNTFKIFLYLVMEANHKPKKWQGTQILRGQLITGRKKIALECKCSEKVVRNSLERLKSTNEVAIQTTNRFSIITVCNYDTYQSKEEQEGQPEGQQRANGGPTEGQQRATTKNDKNDKNDKNYDIYVADADTKKKKVKSNPFKSMTKEEFRASIDAYSNEFSEEKRNDFFIFWSEEDEQGRMKFQLRKTWSVKGRLANWKDYSINNQSTKSGRMTHDEALRIAGERIKEEERLARLRPASLENHSITEELINDF